MSTKFTTALGAYAADLLDYGYGIRVATDKYGTGWIELTALKGDTEIFVMYRPEGRSKFGYAHKRVQGRLMGSYTTRQDFEEGIFDVIYDEKQAAKEAA